MLKKSNLLTKSSEEQPLPLFSKFNIKHTDSIKDDEGTKSKTTFKKPLHTKDRLIEGAKNSFVLQKEKK